MSLRQAVQIGQQSQAAQLVQPTVPLHRFRTKRPVPGQQQQGLPGSLEFDAEATADVKRRVYLVTLPPPTQSHAATGERLVAPGSVAKAKVLEGVLDSCAHPVYVDLHSRSAGCSVPLQLCGVWREFCTASANVTHPEHDHIAVCAVGSFRFLPVKRALLQRHGFASHWSCTHLGYWSCVRYLAMASPKKPLQSLDGVPCLWAAAGVHPPLMDCCYAPVNAKSLSQKRMKLAQVGRGSFGCTCVPVE